MEFKRKNPLIILVAGRARSGKNTFSSYIKDEYECINKKVIFSPYTKYLKQYIVDITGEEIDDNNKPRDLLQQISSKVIKGELNYKDFFIRRQIEDIEIYSYFADVILVSDVRFPDEIEQIKERFSNVISIGVTRKNYISTLTLEQQTDITEVALDNYHNYDYEVINDNETDLKMIAKKIVCEINERRYNDE